MSGNGQNGRAHTGPDARISNLDHEIRRLEDRPTTWVNPLDRTRLASIRKTRHSLERMRLRMGWSLLGTDGSNL